MSVAQPAPELLDLFDNLLLMSKGKQIWFGPPRKAVDYFESLGYCKPKETAYPDFLQEMCGDPHVFYERENDKRNDQAGIGDADLEDPSDTGLDLRVNSIGEKVIRGSYLDVVDHNFCHIDQENGNIYSPNYQ